MVFAVRTIDPEIRSTVCWCQKIALVDGYWYRSTQSEDRDRRRRKATRGFTIQGQPEFYRNDAAGMENAGTAGIDGLLNAGLVA